jgi:hypothetical protein
VEFEEGEIDSPLWVGGGWAAPSGQSELPEEALDDYPDRQVIKTKSGQVILICDASGKEMITIRSKSGCEINFDPNANTIRLDAGEVILQADTVKIQSQNEQPQEVATKTFVTEVFDKHTHPTGVGPTGLPVLTSSMVPLTLTSVLKAE